MRETEYNYSHSAAGYAKIIFIAVLILHVLAVAVPFLLGLKNPEMPEELNINLVDEPSVGPNAGPVTTRKEYSPEPPQEAAPEPVPEPEIPDVPEPKMPKMPEMPQMPPPPPVPAEPNLKLPPLPPKKTVKQPKFNRKLPKKNTPPRRPAKRQAQSRKLTTVKKGRNTGSNSNEFVPIGKEDLAQMFGKKPSNTPQGGPKSKTDYTGKLVGFLKLHWQTYAPSRAELGDAEPEAAVEIAIDGSGNVVEAGIIKPSGNPRFDNAVRRMLGELRKYPAPDDGKPVRIRNIVLDTAD